MTHAMHRRDWLRQTALTLAGTGLIRMLPAAEFSLEESSGQIKISSNENPYGVSPMAREAMIRAVSGSNRYPWSVTGELREKIGRRYGLSADHVLVGAGSSELIGLIATFAARARGNMVVGHPTFKLWFPAAESMGLAIRKVPLTADKFHDLPAMAAAMDQDTRLVYIVNPHNPTGTLLDEAALRHAVQQMSRNAVVLLDEAYIDYTDQQGLHDLVTANPNIIVARTFSKIHGMAGARAGFILAHPDTVAALKPWQAWPNAGMGTVTLAGALAAMDDHEFMDMTRRKNAEVRDTVSRELGRLGIRVIPSHTSFIYYDTAVLRTDLAAACTEANILGVRTYEDGTSWRRTSLGTMDEMERFLEVVRKVAAG